MTVSKSSELLTTAGFSASAFFGFSDIMACMAWACICM